jgi:hypothetical protein
VDGFLQRGQFLLDDVPNPFRIDAQIVVYNTPQNLDQGLRWIRCLNGKSIQETNDGEQA